MRDYSRKTMNRTKELYEKWVALWNGDFKLAREIIASDFVFHRGQNEADWKGPEETVEKIKASRAIFSEINFTTQLGPFVDGEWVIGRNTSRAVYKGGMPGATAIEGTVIELVRIDILRVEDGKFVEAWHNSNDLNFMLQLGLVQLVPSQNRI